MKALQIVLTGTVVAVFVLFALSNWRRVAVVLPDGAVAYVFLPVLVAAAFVAGWLPMLLVHLASRGRWRRRVARTDRLLDEARGTAPPVVPRPAALAAQGQPIVVPPAGA